MNFCFNQITSPLNDGETGKHGFQVAFCIGVFFVEMG